MACIWYFVCVYWTYTNFYDCISNMYETIKKRLEIGIYSLILRSRLDAMLCILLCDHFHIPFSLYFLSVENGRSSNNNGGGIPITKTLRTKLWLVESKKEEKNTTFSIILLLLQLKHCFFVLRINYCFHFYIKRLFCSVCARLIKKYNNTNLYKLRVKWIYKWNTKRKKGDL